MTPTVAPRPGGHARHHVGVALFAFATLVHELLLVRWVSARLLNNFAFLILSLTMAGFAIGSVILTLGGDRVLRRLDRWAPRFMDGYVLATLATWVLFGRVELGDVSSAGVGLSSFLWSGSAALLLCIPFVFSGLGIGAYLSAPGLEPTRVYASDLVGSSVGCLVAIGGIRALGVELTAAAACGVLVGARLLLYRPRGRDAALAAVAALAAAVAVAAPTRVMTIEYPKGSMLAAALDNGGEVLQTRWDPAARVELSRQPQRSLVLSLQLAWPTLIGDDPELLGGLTHVFTQNNFAFTVFVNEDRPAAELRRGVNRTIYGASYAALRARTRSPKVLTVGVGGGIDVLAAVANGAREVTGVEVNAAMLELLAEQVADKPEHFLNDPAVELVRADGRHFLARSTEAYDVIQLSGVDSYSGSQGAAHVFSETYLYTLEAVRIYLRRLTPGGVLNLMRLESNDEPREVLRLLTTVLAALRAEGFARPERHVMAVAQPDLRFVSLLVSKTPWTLRDVGEVSAWTGETPDVALVADPHHAGTPRSGHEAVLRLAADRREAAFIEGYRYQIAPATDDWPFFFQHSRWSHVIEYLRGGDVAVPAMPLMLLFLLALLSGLMLLTVVVPLLVLRRRDEPAAHPVALTTYFGALGLGFMFAEVSLMQRLALLLGGATYSITIVLFALLLALTLGSFLAERVRAVVRTPQNAALAIAALIVAFIAADDSLNALVRWPFAARAGLAFGVSFVPGFLMGPWFPLGLRYVKRASPGYTPWAWGINGVFSVLAPVLATAIASAAGQRVTLATVIPLYLAAGLVAARLGMWEAEAVEASDDDG